MVGLRGESNQRHRGSTYLFIHLPISTKYERLCTKPESIRYPQKVTCDNFGFNATSIIIEYLLRKIKKITNPLELELSLRVALWYMYD